MPVVVEAGEVEVQLESLGGHLLHGLELIEDVLEGREVILHPVVAHGRVFLYGFHHVGRMGGDRPGGEGHPAPVALAEELVDRNSGRLAHQVVGGLGHGNGGLVPDPVEGAGADVLLEHLVRLVSPFAQPLQALVGVNHVDAALGGTVEVIQLVVEPVHVVRMDLVFLDVGDPDRTPDRIGGLLCRQRQPGVLQRRRRQEPSGAGGQELSPALHPLLHVLLPVDGIL